MNLRTAYDESPVSEALARDLARLDEIWAFAREGYGSGGPWLFGSYSVADAFFAPVAARIAGYNLPVSDLSRAYVDSHLGDLAFRRWRAMGLVKGETLPWYAMDYPVAAWPGPKPIEARATDRTDAVNDACPYSGDPVTHFLETEGRVYGFCNAFCRDKTVADPLAWPAFTALLNGS